MEGKSVWLVVTGEDAWDSAVVGVFSTQDAAFHYAVNLPDCFWVDPADEDPQWSLRDAKHSRAQEAWQVIYNFHDEETGVYLLCFAVSA